MAKRKFKAESQRLLDLVINSIYSHKEIFIRELISNASDAIDKMYYTGLTDKTIDFNKEDYFIKIFKDKENRLLTIKDTGIGMTKDELVDNLGVIAKSGTYDFKKSNETHDGVDIIGQFGVGFYSAFMVADEVKVVSKAFGSDEAYKWESNGSEGYTIESCEKETFGTDIILKIKENADDIDYDEYLSEYKIKEIIKKYSDFIRYPIKMDMESSKLKEGTEDEYEEFVEEQIVNSMVPIWRKNKNELTDEDYENFYVEKRYGFDKPIRHIHYKIDGAVSFNALLYIPENTPYDYYTKEYEKGLELYSSSVMIMNKNPELLPDYFSFVKGLVDTEDLSLNISREILQHDRQLKIIAKNIKNKIKKELETLLKEDREKYEIFFKSFGRQLKFGVYNNFGSEKEILQDLIMFYSSKEKKMVTLEEYVSRMPEDQKYIYFASGETIEKIDRMPQTELVVDKGYEILYFTDEVDEFAIKMLMKYKDKEFKSVSSSDLGIQSDEKDVNEEQEKRSKELFEYMKEQLKDKVKDVKVSKRLKQHPVCLSNDGDISIEMEKVLNAMPNDQNIKADKVLEINVNHEVYDTLKTAFSDGDLDKVNLFTNILYNQALLIEGLTIENPVEFADDMWKVLK
ncbi:MAG: molecular chaperone HtpG [Bacillota bacterium]|nr:molecular chaperone HtpG [Bacillota bacterium]